MVRFRTLLPLSTSQIFVFVVDFPKTFSMQIVAPVES